MTTATGRSQRSQEERSAATRLRLQEATITCLVERGWGGTSTTVVSQRAAASRGAQLHHYPTKNDLVLAAVRHLAQARDQDLRQALDGVTGAGTARVRRVLDALAEQFTGPLFVAALELWVAARTDDALRGEVRALESEVGRRTHRLTVETLGIDESRPGARELVQATLDLVRGLGLANSLTDDAARRRRILDQWADTLTRELEAAGAWGGAR